MVHYRNFDNKKWIFECKIKKLFLENITNSTIILKQKCFTTVTMLRCRNVKIIFEKEIYNLELELCCEIDITINKKYKDLIYLWITACMDLQLKTNKNKTLKLIYSIWANESFQNNYYLKQHYFNRYRGSYLK